MPGPARRPMWPARCSPRARWAASRASCAASTGCCSRNERKQGPAVRLTLFAHPFSSYCQKALVALYENGTPFEYRLLSPEDPGAFEELTALWPLRKFPVLVDDGRTIVEATIIIEHLALHHPGPFRPLPEDPRAAL